MRIKPQNRSRIIVLGILSAGWSLLDPATHFSFTELLIEYPIPDIGHYTGQFYELPAQKSGT